MNVSEYVTETACQILSSTNIIKYVLFLCVCSADILSLKTYCGGALWVSDFVTVLENRLFAEASSQVCYSHNILQFDVKTSFRLIVFPMDFGIICCF